jgi:hypothetical protein
MPINTVRIELRKGGGNREFNSIVKLVARTLEQTDMSSRKADMKLLKKLRKTDSGYVARTEYPLFMVGGYRYAVDIYHPQKKIAIEIEKSETKLVWKILCKFIVGARQHKIDHAILIVPLRYRGKRKKTPTRPFNDALRASRFVSQILWNRNIAILGYGDEDLVSKTISKHRG